MNENGQQPNGNENEHEPNENEHQQNDHQNEHQPNDHQNEHQPNDHQNENNDISVFQYKANLIKLQIEEHNRNREHQTNMNQMALLIEKQREKT